jgi:hypothetical protein
MKTDDDIIFNVEQLVNNLKSFKSGITGALIPKRKPNRTIGHKWYIPERTYPDESFPTTWSRKSSVGEVIATHLVNMFLIDL